MKILFLLIMDMVAAGSAAILSLVIRLEGSLNSYHYPHLWMVLPGIVVLRLGCFYAFGLYRRLWRYAGMNELLQIVGAVTCSSILIYLYIYWRQANLPQSTHLINWFVTVFLIGGSRFCVRAYHYWHKLQIRQRETSENVLIVGAGDAGAMIAREIEQRYFKTKKIIGFLDDSVYKQGQQLYGAKVIGGTNDVGAVVQENQVNEIIIAMPSVPGSVVRKIIQECKRTQCKVKTLPGLYELIDGKVSLQQLRDVALEDLLRRESVKLDLGEIAKYLSGKRVLVTGAGGSIGSELCRQIAQMNPGLLVLLGKGENSIYEIEQELKCKFDTVNVKPCICDVRDEDGVEQVFQKWRPQVIFHAAAHKHVPLMEEQPEEAVKNNVFGTKNIAQAADRFECDIFIMISTDKAVNPTSVMGATKRVAELIIQSINQTSKTKFAAVRFGNVLGSRGSVVPLFKRQIAQGGPITITHPDMERYFMTIPEATQLVLQAGAMAQGGEVFVLDMGKPVKIKDMACDLIELSGLEPHKDIQIEYTGIRPGEKMYEELLAQEEGAITTKHSRIRGTNIKLVEWDDLEQIFLSLKNAKSNKDELVRCLESLIDTYKH